jgi:hypothetical protein
MPNIKALKEFREFFSKTNPNQFDFTSLNQYADFGQYPSEHEICGSMFCIGGWASIWARFKDDGTLYRTFATIFDIPPEYTNHTYQLLYNDTGPLPFVEVADDKLTFKIALERLDIYIKALEEEYGKANSVEGSAPTV